MKMKTTVITTVISVAFAMVLRAADTSVNQVSPTSLGNQPARQMSFYVSPDGSDSNAGTSPTSPFRTIQKARDVVRSVNRDMTGDIAVFLKGGRYEQTAPILFGPEDSGTKGHCVRYVAVPGAPPVISGGKRVTGWTVVPGMKYYVASVPASAGYADYFRQLYVNGVRAYRASSPWVVGSSFYHDPKSSYAVDGVNFPKDQVHPYKNKRDVTLFHISSFKVDEWPVVDIVDNGEFIAIQCAQPYFQTRVNRGDSYLTGNDQFLIVNALEELDRPGEWYHDRAAEKIYYYPRPGEDMAKADVVAPAINGDQLLGFVGKSTTDPVCNISFSGIIFEHGNWLFPKDHFIGGSQAEMLFGPNTDTNSPTRYWYEVPGNIYLNHTRGIRFVGNIVRHMAGCGIHLYNDVSDTLVEGNVFYDTTSAGVLIGRARGAYVNGDIPGEGKVKDNVIANNVIRDTGRDFMQATGISIMPALRTRIVHNDIDNAAYMGIHSRMQVKGNYTTKDTDLSPDIGEGYIAFNRVGESNWAWIYGVDDNGSIYNFGPSKGTVIFQNLVCKAHALQGTYNDDNSHKITWKQNVVIGSNHMSRRSVQGSTILYDGNYSTEPPPTEIAKAGFCVVTNFTQLKSEDPATWPAEARMIADHAGLEPQYRHLLNKVPPTPDYGYYLPSGKNLATGPQKTADSGNWKDIERLWDGSLKSGDVTATGKEAWVEYDFKGSYDHLVFVVTRHNYAAFSGTEWKAQVWDTKNGVWIDATQFVAQTADKIQIRPLSDNVVSTKIRLLLQNNKNGGKIGLLEFCCFGNHAS